jgi:hypothetical protein
MKAVTILLLFRISVSSIINICDSGLIECINSPVCGIRADGNRQTYSNNCDACNNIQVVAWKLGSCRSINQVITTKSIGLVSQRTLAGPVITGMVSNPSNRVVVTTGQIIAPTPIARISSGGGGSASKGSTAQVSQVGHAQVRTSIIF